MTSPVINRFWIGLIVTLLFNACQPSSETYPHKTLMDQEIYIEVGEQPQALISRYGKTVDVNNKNFRLKFYSIDWQKNNQGRVTIKKGTLHVSLESVIMVSGTYNETYPEEGFSIYDLSLSLSSSNTILHDQARLKFYEMLGRILKAGWKRCLYDTEPRLTGNESIRRLHETTTSVTTLDPNYIPTLPQWMSLNDQSTWRFYKDRIYMDVQLSRDQKHLNPDLPGAYFVSISLESYTSKWRTLFDEDDRPRWRELLMVEKEKASKERSKSERVLEALHYHIDTTYRNPDADETETDTEAVPAYGDKPASQPLVPAPHAPPSSLKSKISH